MDFVRKAVRAIGRCVCACVFVGKGVYVCMYVGKGCVCV